MRYVAVTTRTPLWALTPPSWVSLTATTPAAHRPASLVAMERTRAIAIALHGVVSSVRRAIRTLHYSRRTEKAYVYWVRRFVEYHARPPPADMGANEIRSFLSCLAVRERVSASTQNQALCALLFLYGRVLGRDMERIEGIEHAKVPKRLPVVLTRDEVKAVLDLMRGTPRLVCRLLYGGGFRLTECLSLRVKDLDFERREITVRAGKGAKDRVTSLPASCNDDLRAHLERVRRLHAELLLAEIHLERSKASPPAGTTQWMWGWKRSI